MSDNTCIMVVGATAVGKTALSVQLAKLFNTDIISFDSRQCYQELQIGVSKPSQAQLKDTRHYFIDSHSISQQVNAAIFEQYALSAAAEIFKCHDTAVLVGGTGLYAQAFCEGLDEIPVISQSVRESTRSGYEAYGLHWLQQQVALNDPGYFNAGDVLNPQRLMRCLEVKLSTGRSIQSFQANIKKVRSFQVKKIGLQLGKEMLDRQINKRVDVMIEQGLAEEVRSLVACNHLNALNTVGYKELFEHFEGKVSMGEAIENIKKHTRDYAKRQMTWFRRDISIKWFSPGDMEGIKSELGNSK
ncbi:MAG: tRNA (adenosine(37)-N6)-dimethylallyltransferase MiaA [Chitinophagaceae bacterium]